jgi:hypothetical protein
MNVMKAILLSFLFLISAGLSASKSQTYTPFSETSDAFWVDCTMCGNIQVHIGQSSVQKTFGISYFQGDTLMNGLMYKKVFRKTVFTNQPPSFGPTDTTIGTIAEPRGFFRQDIPNKKGYFRRTLDTLDRLLFDFSKIPGDTLRYFTYHPIGQSLIEVVKVVGSFDSVLFKGTYRRKVQYHHVQTNPSVQLFPGNFYEAIEGIGDFTGLDVNLYSQNMRMQTCNYFFLASYCVDGEQLVFNNMVNPISCSLLSKVSGIPNDPIDQIAFIYPNPVGRGESIKFGTTTEPMTVRAYLPDGRIIEETVLIEEWKAPNKPGLYLLRLFDQKGKLVHAQKLLVE